MTQRPSRLRRWMKWVGLVACVVLLICWRAEHGRSVVLHVPGKHGLAIGNGAIHLSIARSRVGTIVKWADSWGVTVFGNPQPSSYWPYRRPEIWYTLGGSKVFTLPLWIPLAIVAIPTAILWYRDRRPPPGRCQECGYDLTGNLSGVCPECGMPT